VSAIAPFLACALVSVLGLAAPAAAEAPFFAGRTVDLIVGMPPGGGEDAYARLVQRHLATHVPGAPTIVVQNVPGAGSLRSVFAVSRAAADGTVIGSFSSSLIIEAIAAPERAQVDLRDFAFLGNVSEDIRVCYVSSAIGVRGIADLARREPVAFGATAVGTSGNVDAAILRKLMGVRIKEVDGYAGSAAKRLAIENGEIAGDCGGFTSLPEGWLKDGRITILVRMSPRPCCPGSTAPFRSPAICCATPATATSMIF
jgi:tripartite-type tricarboxylate transporter receptor subunit TctC